MANLIINTTAVRNNGDVALIVTLADALIARGHSVTFATPHPNHMRKIHGRANVCGEVLGYKSKLFQYRPFADAAALYCLLLKKPYRRAHAVIGAPGGYVNSYYGFSWRMATYRWAHRLGKKTAIYAQSIGPLNASDHDELADFSNDLDILMTRDLLSEKTALSAGFSGKRLLPSIDAFFLSPLIVSARSRESNVVAISVREWKYDGRDVAVYKDLIFNLAATLLQRSFSIEFISTCQGISGYIDDSRLATTIANQLRIEHSMKASISVIKVAHKIEDFRERIATYRMVVGTRLHMCLMAMGAGVPAFNISYESKGHECYKYLDLSEYSVDYNASNHLAIKQLENFLANEMEIRNRLPGIWRKQHIRASHDLNMLLERLEL